MSGHQTERSKEPEKESEPHKVDETAQEEAGKERAESEGYD